MKLLPIFIFFLLSHSIFAQVDIDGWITDQLSEVLWQRNYEGMLADYHPVSIVLASDKKEIAGYLVHKGDLQKHRLIGEWNDSRLFQLQERDENGRLTGYLTGKIKDDQLDLKWISINQDRIFEIKATTDQIVKLNSKTPAAEWIVISSDPQTTISVQKMGNGQVAGLALVNEHYVRFEGACMDGVCSVWKTSFNDRDGHEMNLQMHQKAPMAYKANLNNTSYNATVLFSYPLEIRHVDQSAGFIDFTFPKLEDNTYNEWIDAFWNTDSERLLEAGSLDLPPRLDYRSSGWIEIIGQSDSYVSGLVTFINPLGTHRESFLLLKKEGELINPMSLLNAPEDFSKGAEIAMAAIYGEHDKMMYAWLKGVGYEVLAPTAKGLIMVTEFNTIYGDELQMLSIPESKSLIKKKYWKYFDW